MGLQGDCRAWSMRAPFNQMWFSMSESLSSEPLHRRAMIEQLDAVARLARGRRWHRVRAAPRRYLSGMWWRHVHYRLMGRGRMVQAHTFFGMPMQVVLPAGMDVYLLGAKTHDSELRLARYLIRHLPRGAAALDVGAHYGFFALLMGVLVGAAGRVHAFEASPTAFSVLRSNAGRCSPVRAHHLACSDEAGQVSFYEFPIAYSEYNTLQPEQYERAPWRVAVSPVRLWVPAEPLDAFLDSDEQPALVKIDVEGAEARVVAGMCGLLECHKPVVVMEFQSEAYLNEPHQRAAALLAAKGYRPFRIDAQGGLVPLSDVVRAVVQSGLESDNVVWQHPAAELSPTF